MQTIAILQKTIESEEFRRKLLDIYREPSRINGEVARYLDALNSFRSLYGDLPAGIFSAPGRTEIGGNHTDHQHGEVLAASINDDAIKRYAITGLNKDNVSRLNRSRINVLYPLFCYK